MAARGELERVQSEMQIEEHIRKQEQGFKLQGIGIALILAIVLSASIGVFGDGILSNRNAVSGDVKLSYERFYRHEAKMDLTMEVRNTAGELLISLPKDYLSKLDVVSIVPQPISTRQENGKFTYVFQSNGTALVNFQVAPKTTGVIDGLIHVNNAEFSVSHFIYP